MPIMGTNRRLNSVTAIEVAGKFLATFFLERVRHSDTQGEAGIDVVFGRGGVEK